MRYSPNFLGEAGAWAALEAMPEDEVNDLAYACKAKQEYPEAERLFRRALALVEQRLGGFDGSGEPASPSAEEAIAVNNLATVLKLQGEVRGETLRLPDP